MPALRARAPYQGLARCPHLSLEIYSAGSGVFRLVAFFLAGFLSVSDLVCFFGAEALAAFFATFFFFLPPPLAARSAIRLEACSSVIVSASLLAGMVALVEPSVT